MELNWPGKKTLAKNECNFFVSLSQGLSKVSGGILPPEANIYIN